MKRQVASHLDSQVDKIEYQDQIFYIKDSPDQSMTWKEVAGESIRSPGGPICASGSVTKVQEAPAFAALLVDVEVDLDTGKIKLLRCTCFQDVGCAINPQQVEGQLQGGTTQGIGWALHEYYHYENGVLRNPSWLDYRTATSLDVPMIDTVIIEKPASVGPYGARGVGEVSITPPPAAIANAVYRASGIRLNKLPMSPESVFWAVRRSRES
jgi:CO/xanthine dehydrogenase Mo-binding subunit